MLNPIAAQLQCKISCLIAFTILILITIFPLNATDYSVPGFVWQIQSGDVDVDGDGDMDILVNSTEGICLSRNNGDGSFAPSIIVIPGATYFVVCSQLDNQQGDDLLVLRTLNNVPIALEGYFNGDFSHPVIYPFRTDVTCESNFEAKCGDFNYDGLNDIVISGLCENPSNHRYWCYMFNLGNHQFSAPVWVQSLYSVGFRSMAIGDFNEDNLDDIVFLSTSSYIYYSTGTGFSLAQLDGYNQNYHVVAVDFDNDGDTDIVTNAWEGGDTQRFRFYENMPDSSFTFHTQLLSGFCKMYAADVNGDHYPDLITMEGGSTYFDVFLNLQNWNVDLHTIQVTSYGEERHYCSFAKFDNNNSIDIAVIRYGRYGSNLFVLFNDGNGNFMDNPTSIQDNSVPEPIPQITCYPNPCRNNINFKLNMQDSSNNYSIYNIKGQLVQQIKSIGAKYTWDLSDKSGKRVKGGIYLIKEDSNLTSQAKKFIVLN